MCLLLLLLLQARRKSASSERGAGRNDQDSKSSCGRHDSGMMVNWIGMFSFGHELVAGHVCIRVALHCSLRPLQATESFSWQGQAMVATLSD
jgi:hypothetical protein